MEYTFTVDAAGVRIDTLLPQFIPDLSRSAGVRLLMNGHVRCNGQLAGKNRRSKEGDVLVVTVPDPVDPEPQPEDIPLDIVYEDEDIVVINKARGMVVHPAPGHPNGTLVNALLWHCGDTLSGIGGEKRPGIVHRIDKDTTGLLVCAKNDAAHMGLSEQLQDHSLARTYEAVICGHLREQSGCVHAALGRDGNDRIRMVVKARNGKDAITHYEVIAEYPGYSHIRCQLETGRTHQIRVHMAYLGHPLLGDTLYGHGAALGLEGQCLHACALRFIHPRTQLPMELTAPLPPYFVAILDQLKESV